MARRKAQAEPLPLVPATWMTGGKLRLRIAKLAQQSLHAAQNQVD